MPRSTFRPEVSRAFTALSTERELTQAEHFELRRLVAGKQTDKAIALLNEIFERDANVLRALSRLQILEIKEAQKILTDEIQPTITGRGSETK